MLNKHHHLQEPQQPFQPPWSIYGNTLVLTSSTLKDLSTLLSLTSTQGCRSFTKSLHLHVMLQRQYLSRSNYLKNMEFQNLYAVTMVHNCKCIICLIFHIIGNFITTQVHSGIPYYAKVVHLVPPSDKSYYIWNIIYAPCLPYLNLRVTGLWLSTGNLLPDLYHARFSQDLHMSHGIPSVGRSQRKMKL